MPFNEEYFNSEDFKELLNYYEASMKVGEHPFMDVDDLVDIADYYNHYERADEAIEVIEHALQLYPSATLPNVFMARQALMDCDYNMARHYSDCIEDQDDPDYHYLQAEILIAEGHIKEADKYLRDYEKRVDPDEYQDYVKDCANLYYDYGESQKALEWMMRSPGDNSDDFKELMAHILFCLGKFSDSERVFNELIDNNPYASKYWKALAGTQLANGEFSNAVTSSEYAIAIDPNDAEGLLTKANALLQLENYEEAEKYYERYSEINPSDEAGHFYRGVCLIYRGKLQEALEALLHAEALSGEDSPFISQIYQEQAFCYSSLKQPKKAIEVLEKSASTMDDPNHLLVLKGHILLENNLNDEAEEMWRKAMVNSNYSATIMMQIVASLYDNHYIEACYDILKRAYEYYKEEDNALSQGYPYLALCCHDLGHKEEFLHYLKLATEKYPRETRFILGFLFPKDMDVNDYYNYITQQIKE